MAVRWAGQLLLKPYGNPRENPISTLTLASRYALDEEAVRGALKCALKPYNTLRQPYINLTPRYNVNEDTVRGAVWRALKP